MHLPCRCICCETVKESLISPAGGFQSTGRHRSGKQVSSCSEKWLIILFDLTPSYMFETVSNFKRKGRLRNHLVVCLVRGFCVHMC